jgi:hypothetical protein
MATIETMYQYSLTYFVFLLLQSIEASKHTKDERSNHCACLLVDCYPVAP